MKQIFKSMTVMVALFALLLSVSCGSGSDGGSAPGFNTNTGLGGSDASGGIGGTGITGFSKGTISGFGSVIVNGVKFETSDTTFSIDDQSGSQSGLAVGMVVEVQGNVNDDGTTGTAALITFDEDLKGPIDSRNLINNSFVALGRTVIVDASTKIIDDGGNALSFSGLNPDDMVKVSGLIFADETLQATHIRKTSPSSEVELKGTIKLLDEANKTFSIGNQSIQYTDGTTLDDSLVLANDAFVEVKGTRDTGGILNATKIEPEDGSPSLSGISKMEIEGLVTSFTSSLVFSVNGQAVATSSSTSFEDGAPDDIAINVRLEVEGSVNSAGVLVATKVKFHGNRIKIEADVDGIDTATNTVTLLGIKVVINASTRMDDKTGTVGSNFSISDLSAGNHLEIRGYLSEGVVTATRVDREKTGTRVILQAPVEAFSEPNLTLLSVTVDTSSADFKDLSGGPLTSGAFFSQVKVNDLVKARGTFSGGTLTADEVEFED